jgi:hypothetical protein
MFIPIANFIVLILVAMSIAKNFNKSGGFGIGLALLPIVFYSLLAFGDAQLPEFGDAGGQQAFADQRIEAAHDNADVKISAGKGAFVLENVCVMGHVSALGMSA